MPASDDFDEFYRTTFRPGVSRLIGRRTAMLPLSYLSRFVGLIMLVVFFTFFDSFLNMNFWPEDGPINVFLSIFQVFIALVLSGVAFTGFRKEIKKVWVGVRPDLFNSERRINLISIAMTVIVLVSARVLGLLLLPRDLGFVTFFMIIIGMILFMVLCHRSTAPIRKSEENYARDLHHKIRHLVLSFRQSKLDYQYGSKVSESAFKASLMFDMEGVSYTRGKGLLVSPGDDPDYILGHFEAIEVSHKEDHNQNTTSESRFIFSGMFSRLTFPEMPVGHVFVNIGGFRNRWLRDVDFHPITKKYPDAKDEQGRRFSGMRVKESDPGLAKKLLTPQIRAALGELEALAGKTMIKLSFIDHAIYLGFGGPEFWGPEVLLPTTHRPEIERAYALWTWLDSWPEVVNAEA